MPIHKRNASALIAVAINLLFPSICRANDSHAAIRVVTGTSEVRGWEKSIIRKDPTLAKWHWDPMTYSNFGYNRVNDVYTKRTGPHQCYAKPIKQPFLCIEKPKQHPYITMPNKPKAPAKPYITAVPTTSLAYKPYITLPEHAKPAAPYIDQELVHASLMRKETSARLMQQQVAARLADRKVQADLVQEKVQAQLIERRAAAELVSKRTLIAQIPPAVHAPARTTPPASAAPTAPAVVSEPVPVVKVASYGGSQASGNDDFASLSGYSIRRESSNASGRIVSHAAASAAGSSSTKTRRSHH